MQLKIGQVSKFKIHGDNGDYYELRDIKNNSFKLFKRFTYRKKMVKNQFVHLHVFKDKKDSQLYLSTKLPILKSGEIGSLKVVEVVKEGFFLHNGFERDVFLAVEDKRTYLSVDDFALVKLLANDQDQQRATMQFDFKTVRDGSIQLGSYMKARVIHVIKRDDKFLSGVKTVAADGTVIFINRADMGRPPRINEVVDVRITSTREDGYLNGSLLAPQKKRRLDDTDVILNYMIANNGITAMTDKSEPERILKEVGLSKKAFKKGVGILLSSGQIEIKENKMWLLKKQ